MTSISGYNSQLPDHISFSALDALHRCPRSYRLGRVDKKTPKQAWFFAVGTAVHQVVEGSLRGYLDETGKSLEQYTEDAFIAEVERLMKIDPARHQWAHAGSDEEPVTGDRALSLTHACVQEALMILDEIDVWEVELDVSGHLSPCPIPIMGFADVIGEHKKHGPVIGDWKTGKSKPKNGLQLETYNALMKAFEYTKPNSNVTDIPFKGMWLMVNPNRGVKKREPFVFKETPESIGLMYADAWRQIERRIFPAKVGYNCNFCLQEVNCKEMLA